MFHELNSIVRMLSGEPAMSEPKSGAESMSIKCGAVPSANSLAPSPDTVSVLIAFLVGRGSRAQSGWMIAMGLVNLAFVGLITLELLTGGTVGDPGFVLTTDSWWTGVQDRVEYFSLFRSEGFLVLPLSTVLFLAGARLYKAGALEGTERGRRIQRRLVVWGRGGITHCECSAAIQSSALRGFLLARRRPRGFFRFVAPTRRLGGFFLYSASKDTPGTTAQRIRRC